MERGGAGPSAAEGAPCACRATVTVLRGCAGMHEATWRAREQWAAQNSVTGRCWLRLAATGGSATAEAAGIGDARRHRRLRPSKRACGALVKEKGPCATRQGARVISDNSLTKNDTANLNFLNFLKMHMNSAGQVFDEMILACGEFSLS